MEWKTAAQMRAETPPVGEHAAFQKLQKIQMEKIEQANMCGSRRTLLLCGASLDGKYYDLEYRNTEWLRRLGYGIEPVGVIGGVVQEDHYVTWG